MKVHLKKAPVMLVLALFLCVYAANVIRLYANPRSPSRTTHTVQLDPDKPDWWMVSADDPNNESGTLKEIKDKHKVFLNIIYNASDLSSPREGEVIRLFVRQVLDSYKKFEIVSLAENADLTIAINASRIDEPSPGGQGGNFSAGLDAATQTPLSVVVVVRGSLLRNGSYRTRIIWELTSPNVRGDPGPAAAFAVDGLVRQLKKLRGEK